MRFLKFFGLFVICLFFVSCGLHQDSTTEKQRHFDSSSKQNSLEKSKWKSSFWVEADKDTKSGYPYMNNMIVPEEPFAKMVIIFMLLKIMEAVQLFIDTKEKIRRLYIKVNLVKYIF